MLRWFYRFLEGGVKPTNPLPDLRSSIPQSLHRDLFRDTQQMNPYVVAYGLLTEYLRNQGNTVPAALADEIVQGGVSIADGTARFRALHKHLIRPVEAHDAWKQCLDAQCRIQRRCMAHPLRCNAYHPPDRE
jgi:hypothetical protein